ncbi:MarR family winged helix-turn-helix transcriptional regulator [Streptomyces sp. NPDC096311]|uniref:MarR family winged helix-turn-helix transcriptional regulator n=1 Tax=Streptomyces sp. NPDC096311 TaxID=3366083 RepID=UPI003826FF40
MDEAAEPQWLDAEEQWNWFQFAYALVRVPAALEAQAQRDAGIGHFEYLVLSALSMAPEHTLRMSDLAEFTASALSRLSNAVSRLEKRDWVHREPDPADGRYTLATLTEDGLAKVEISAPGHVAEVRRIVFDPLTKAQQRQLGVIAQRMLRAIEPDHTSVEERARRAFGVNG